eukprot:g70426.t1
MYKDTAMLIQHEGVAPVHLDKKIHFGPRKFDMRRLRERKAQPWRNGKMGAIGPVLTEQDYEKLARNRTAREILAMSSRRQTFLNISSE